ncbi:MAG: patatin-like phospholipase family protein [Candidatus Peribacteraceae bacterium]|nr:patatin-like phospholipase family protein [Candidatus Peribacteraceae bacterium]
MTWGLALSGGIALGLANAGVAEALEEEGLRPDFLAGSSMGAVIGALYALGHPIADLKKLLRQLKPWNAVRWSDAPLRGGLQGGLLQQNLREHLGEFAGDARVGDCRIPFVCVAGEVTGKVAWQRLFEPGFMAEFRRHIRPYVFPPETRVLDALMATSAIPVVFSPVRIGDRLFVDLGATGAIPSLQMRDAFRPDVLVCTDTAPRYGTLRDLFPRLLSELARESEADLRAGREACDLVITPPPAAGFLRFDKGEAFAAAGRKATMEALPALRTLLGRPAGGGQA